MSQMQTLDDSPFAAFVMSEFHEPEVARIVAREEAAATEALGFVACPGDHTLRSLPCLTCGASL